MSPPNICAHCGAIYLGGRPLHEMWTSYSGVDRVEHWCIQCIEEYSEACWDYERGPYPFTVTTHLSGRA